MSGSRGGEIFELDDGSIDSEAEAGSARSHSTDEHDNTPTAGPSDRSSIDPFRRAMPQIEAEEDVCSICLDAFTEDDPANATVCEHKFHLQCIMQWAQRSRECPLCFRSLALQDPAMQELLPFGEYVPPESGVLPAAFLEFGAWDMDALLQRLALQSGTHARRSRTRQRHRTQSLQAPLHGGEDSEVQTRGRIPTSSQSQEELPSTGEDSYPSSWPPRGMPLSDACENGNAESMHRLASGADTKSTSESLKSRWFNFRTSIQSRCRESLSNATSGLKSRSDKGEGGSQAQQPH